MSVRQVKDGWHVPWATLSAASDRQPTKSAPRELCDPPSPPSSVVSITLTNAVALYFGDVKKGDAADERRSGAKWGDISDAAPRLGLARHATPGSILYRTWVNNMSLGRARLAIAPLAQTAVLSEQSGWWLRELSGQKDWASEGKERRLGKTS